MGTDIEPWTVTFDGEPLGSMAKIDIILTESKPPNSFISEDITIECTLKDTSDFINKLLGWSRHIRKIFNKIALFGNLNN